MIEFVNTSWWPLSLIGFLVIVTCWIWSEKRRHQTLSLLLNDNMAKKLSSSACSLKRLWRNILFTAAACFLLFSILRPYSGIDTEERQQSTRDIMVLFDISNSMNVIDAFGESRLKYGKGLITKLVNSLPADRFGLMSFAGLAFLECPMTSDTYSFEAALDDMNSDKIPLGGTNIEIALSQVLNEYNEGAPHKAIVLISDGEEIGGSYTAATQKMKDKGIKVVTVQIGDESKAGSVRNSQGRAMRDKTGQLLTSQADSATLSDIAKKTGGIHLPFDADSYSGVQLNQIVTHIKNMNTGEGEKETIQKPREIYQPFLLAAILLLMARMLIGERKKVATVISTISMVLISLQLSAQSPTTIPTPHNSSPKINTKQHGKLNKLQNAEIDLIAQTKDKTNDSKYQFLAWYNLGLNLAKQHSINPTQQAPTENNEEEKEPTLFERASQAYITASSIPQENLNLQSSAIHNRAALFHQEARKIFLENPDKALELLTEAQSSYRQALSLQVNPEKSARNLELSYLHMKDAELAKEMLKFHEEALQNCGESLLGIRSLKEHTILVDKILNSLKQTNNAASKAHELAMELEAQNHQKAYTQVKHLISKSANSLQNILNNEELFTQTEKDIAEAYRLLGGNPDQPDEQQQKGDQGNEQEKNKDKQQQNEQEENKDKQQQNQQEENKDKQQQNQQEKNKDKQQQNQQEGQNKDKDNKENKPDSEKLNSQKQEGDFKKKQQEAKKKQEENMQNAKVREAEALLRKMGDTEKKVREYIRQQQAKEMEQQLREQGIYIAPESNK